MAPKVAEKKKARVTKCKRVGGKLGKGQYVNERGTGMKFKVESYDFISRFTGKTRIKYVPNPKTPGSKSFTRYKLYEKAKTVGDALKHCKPVDLLWEYERGYLKVLGGPMADKPACLDPNSKDSKDPAIRILSKFHGARGNTIKMDPAVREKLSKLAKEYGMDLDKIHEDAGKQCNSECADVQTGRLLANEMARRILASGKAVRDQEVVNVLQIWGFHENTGRINVMREGVKSVHSDTLGIIRTRQGPYRIFDPTTRYKHVTVLINKWFTENKGSDIPREFGWTSININHNYAGARHRDANNEGPSVIKAIGKFTGGKLNYWPKDEKKPGRCDVGQLSPKDSVSLDLFKKFEFFSGNSAHEVDLFKGERFSLVFFSTGKYWKMKAPEHRNLTKLGFKIPTMKDLKTVKDISKRRNEEMARRLRGK